MRCSVEHSTTHPSRSRALKIPTNMSLLNSHLEQITLSSNAIADLPSVLVISLKHVALTNTTVQVPSPTYFHHCAVGLPRHNSLDP